MLYGNKTISHYSRGNIAVWMLMAFQAGLLNIGGLLACHSFVSHLTGFATLFGHEMARSNPQKALALLAVPFFFLFGAMISGFLVDLRIKLHKKPKYYISFGVIFFLCLAVAVLGTFGFFGSFGNANDSLGEYILLILLCLICGIQNGTITSVSKSVIRTTHLTGITTDLGIGLVRAMNKDQFGETFSNEHKANLMRIGIIFFFIFGSLAGAFAFQTYSFYGFYIPVFTSGILYSLMLYFQLYKVEKKSGE